jgi:Asp-tRNA(Asn)/Glu-tRNA(Gln) amidotransferase A subunit family amidase
MLNRMSLTAMTEAVRAGRVSAEELVEAHLAEIGRREGELHAFMEVFAEEAREQARRAGREGLLAGAPVTVKDSFDIAGRLTACGSRLRLDAEAAREDATVVKRLRAAGAVILGKTACPEFLMNYETESGLKEATRNPADLERTAGGSSGGEAAAIAAYCSAGGMGSDGGGSIREPAGFCGIVGLKPAPGRVSAAGHWPEIAHPGGLLGVAGPMARTVGDVRLLFRAVAGHDARDPFSVPCGQGREEAPERVYVLDGFTMTAGVRAGLERAARRCEEAGFAVEAAPRGLLGAAHELWRFLFIRVNAALLRAYIGGREAECHWTGLELIGMVEEEREPTAAELCGVLMERDRLRGRVCGWLEERRAALLAPVCGRTAWKPGERDFDLLEAVRPLTFANVLGLPALAVPAGRDEEGLPVGVQFAGAPWSEEGLLELGERYERVSE